MILTLFLASQELGLWLLDPTRTLQEVESGTLELLERRDEPLALCMASWSLASKGCTNQHLYTEVASAIDLNEVLTTARGPEAVVNTARAFAVAAPSAARDLFRSLDHQRFTPEEFALISRSCALIKALPFGHAAPAATARAVLAHGKIREIPDFVTAEEAASLIGLAEWQPSRAHGQGRTSESALLPKTDLVDDIAARAAALFGLHRSHCETLQLVRYRDKSHYYTTHCDVLDDDQQLLVGGQRVATVLIYLTDVDEGGETRFPELTRVFKPTLGTAVAFTTVQDNGEPDLEMAHAALPTSQTKIAVNCWLRAFPGADRL